jgi:hypothetical protein
MPPAMLLVSDTLLSSSLPTKSDSGAELSESHWNPTRNNTNKHANRAKTMGFSCQKCMGYGVLQSYGVFSRNHHGGHQKPTGLNRVWVMAGMAYSRCQYRRHESENYRFGHFLMSATDLPISRWVLHVLPWKLAR